ncbi:S8 family serine peptidase [Anoxybacterium hadale]|uniref:S8 family serine peptidase n=1 Tax=Anoxybacterium hadale TaxID=3408580 RepID=A0ACD1ABW8_9FIRM|nr:S8 family serine peptidase [Clostridiales bacterium]
MCKKILAVIALMIVLLGFNLLNVPSYSYALTESNPFSASDKAHNELLQLMKGEGDIKTSKLSKLSLDEERQNDQKQKQASKELEEKRYIVKFNDSASLQKVYDVVKTYDYELIGKSEQRMLAVKLDDLAKFKLQAAEMIEFIEQDHLMKLHAVPNDAYYSEQWGLTAVNMPKAWDVSKGSNKVFVAVIDSGVERSHLEIAKADVRAGYDYIYGGSCDWDFFEGHGTNVTGIIGAATNNSTGIAGVNWNVAVIPLAVVDFSGKIYESVVIQAINDAAAMGCDVINLSIGGPDYSDAMNRAIQNALSKGCIVVASAGNDGNSSYSYPASYDGVISVGSVNSDLSRSSFSQYNNAVDVVGPGSNILTTADPKYSYSDYEYVDGTSFSAPHVSGIAALAAARDSTLTPAKMRSLIQTTSKDLGTKGYDNYFGYGLINAGEIMKVISNPPTVPAGLTVSVTGSKQCTLKWSAVSGAASYTIYRATSAEGSYTKLATATGTSYIDSGVKSGSSYWYKISATNGVGTSAQSGAVSVIIAIPGVPTGLTTSVTSASQCTVKWSAVAGAVSYDVYRATSATGTYTKLATVTSASYVNSGLTKGSAYWYKVSATNGLGTSAQSGAASVTMGIPGVPGSLTTSITGSGQCTIKWSAASGAVSYDLYRATSSSGTYTKLTTVTGTSYVNSGLTSGASYWYKVSAVNAMGASAQSAAASVKIAIPAVPSGLAANVTGSTQVTVKWSAASGAASYDIYRATSASGSYTKLGASTGTSYMDNGVKKGSSYWYKISAANAIGASAQSGAASVTIAVPGVPTGLIASVTSTSQCTIKWSAVSGAVSYDVYRGASATGTYTKLTTVTGTSYGDSGLKAGASYWYKVAATNAIGTSAQSAASSVSLATPGVPAGLTAGVTGSSQCTVKWNGVSGAASYDVYRAPSASGAYTKLATVTTSSYADNAVAAGASYWYKISAANPLGVSAQSSAISVKIAVPAVPSGLTISVTSSSQSTLKWNAASGAVSYDVYRASSSSGTYTKLATVTSPAYTDTGLKTASSYWYKVSASNALGTSAQSAAVSVTMAIPGVPSGLATAVTSSTQCTVKWSPVSGAVSYDIYRATSATGTFSKLATITGASYGDSGLKAGSSYWYKVRATNALGSSAQSAAANVTIAVPAVPAGLTASITGGSQCTVRWSSVSGAVSYDIYRATSAAGTYTKLTTVTGTSYLDNGVTTGSSYWYKASAVNAMGASAQTSAVSVKIAAPGVPAGIITSVTSSTQCVVKWNAVSGAVSYDIYRAASATGTYTKLANVTSASYTDNGLTTGSAYWYRISAVNALGASAQSGAVSVSMAIPGVPAGLTTGVTSSSQCILKWSAASGAVSYDIYRATSATGTFTKIGTAAASSYTDSGLKSGTSYWYKVRSTNALGSSAQSSAVSVTMGIPTVPSGLTASVTGSSQCTIKWSAASGAVSYDIYRATSSAGTYTKLATVTATSYGDNGVAAGSAYWYKVSAANAMGASAQSGAVNVTIAIPGAPSGLITSVTSSSQCTVKWSGVSGAVSYDVYRSTSSAGTYTKLTTVTGTSYVNSGLTAGSSYWYKVSAVNALGASAQSGAVGMTIAVPSVPSGLAVSVTGTTQCTVKWTGVSGAVSYDVYRATSASGTYTKLATVTTNSYINTGLTSGSSYWYKISATNAMGTSAQSGAVSVKLAIPGIPAGVTASVTGSTQCTLKWSAVAGAVSYDVYRATSAAGTYTKLTTVTANSYANSGLTVGATYWYKVSAVNALGSSAQSSPVSVSIPVPVTGILLNPNTMLLMEGGATGTLTATVSPVNATNKAVTWTSSDNNVATVVNGIVTPVSTGTTTITAAAQAGGFKATCTVTVKPAVIQVSGISLDKEHLILIAGGSEEAINATVKPETASNKKVIWISSDTDVAMVNDGIVTPVSSGSATITATTEAGGFTDTCSVTVSPPEEEEPDLITQGFGVVAGFSTFDPRDVKLFAINGEAKIYPVSDELDYVSRGQLVYYELNEEGEIVVLDSDNAVSTDSGTIILSSSEIDLNGTVYSIQADVSVFFYGGVTPEADSSRYDIGTIGHLIYGSPINSPVSIYVVQGEVVAMLVPKSANSVPEPTGLKGIAPTSDADDDGRITGTNSDMEYKLSTETNYIEAIGTEISGLAAGDYHVRYAARDGKPAGGKVTVTVPPYIGADHYGLVVEFDHSFDPRVKLMGNHDGGTGVYLISRDIDIDLLKGWVIAYGLDESGEIGAIDRLEGIQADTGLKIESSSSLSFGESPFEISDDVMVFTYDGSGPDNDGNKYKMTSIEEVVGLYTSPVMIYTDEKGLVVALLIPASS